MAAKSGAKSIKRAAVVAASAAAALLLARIPSSAHIPITTKITFNSEVVRILQRNCLACHRPGGISFSLATYQDARPWAKDIEYEVLMGKMPPWAPIQGYGDFVNAPQLTPQDIDLIVSWTEGGAPAGEDKDYPSIALFPLAWPMGQPDLTLQAASETVPARVAVTRSIALPTGLASDRWLRAVDVKPGNGQVVRSVSLYLVGRGGIPDQLLGSWSPDQKPTPFPPDSGWRIPARAFVRARIFYQGIDTPATDRTLVGLYFLPKPPFRLVTSVPVDVSAHSNVDKKSVIRIDAQYTTVRDGELIAISPRPLPGLLSFQASVTRPDGETQVALWATRGLDWSRVYFIRRPELLPAGTQIKVLVYLNRSDDTSGLDSAAEGASQSPRTGSIESWQPRGAGQRNSRAAGSPLGRPTSSGVCDLIVAFDHSK